MRGLRPALLLPVLLWLALPVAVLAQAERAVQAEILWDRYSYVAALEFSSPVPARALIAYGNASQEGSPHRTDQIGCMARGELREVWRTRAEIEANLSRRTTF